MIHLLKSAFGFFLMFVGFSLTIVDNINAAGCTSGDLVDQTNCLICNAITNHNDNSLSRLLQSPYANLRDNRVCNPLVAAISVNNVNGFHLAVANGADVNMINGFTSNQPILRFLSNKYLSKWPPQMDQLNAYRLILDAGFPADTPTRNAPLGFGMSELQFQIYLACANEPLRLSLSRLLISKGADMYRRVDGGLSILTLIASEPKTDCALRILEALNYGPLTKTNLEAKNNYSDSVGTTIVDYSISNWDYRNNRPGYPPNKCIYDRQNAAFGQYNLALTLSAQDNEIANEFNTKKRQIGRSVACMKADIAYRASRH